MVRVDYNWCQNPAAIRSILESIQNEIPKDSYHLFVQLGDSVRFEWPWLTLDICAEKMEHYHSLYVAHTQIRY